MTEQIRTGLSPSETQVARWLALSRLDGDRAAEKDGTDPEDAVFHWQQSAEKALKAFLALHGQPLRKTHDLSALLLRAAAIDIAFAAAPADTEKVSSFATVFRYPNEEGMVMPSQEDIEEARRLCGWVYAEVSRQMPESIRNAATRILEARRSALAQTDKAPTRPATP